MKLKVETTLENFSPKEKKFELETTGLKQKEMFYGFKFPVTRRPKSEERQIKLTVEEEGNEKVVDGEGKELWRGRNFTVTSPNL